MAELTQAYLKTILNYDPDTGIFTWRVQKAYSLQIGDRAGYITDGYVRIEIDQRNYRAQRLAWLYMTGEWPEGEVDHRNTIRSDNRWENLRDATHAQNQYNANLKSNNTSGFKGVYFRRDTKKWRSTVSVNGKDINLGQYDTAEEAHAARCAGAIIHHGEFARV